MSSLVDCHFVAMGPICMGFSPFYFLFIVCFCFFLWLVCIRAFICLILLMDGFLSLIFLYTVFLLFLKYSVPGSLQPGTSFKAQFTQGVQAKVEPKSSNLSGVATKNILVPRIFTLGFKAELKM
jgi:hypothetical protein